MRYHLFDSHHSGHIRLPRYVKDIGPWSRDAQEEQEMANETHDAGPITLINVFEIRHDDVELFLQGLPAVAV
jgi:hypothetical protein